MAGIPAKPWVERFRKALDTSDELQTLLQSLLIALKRDDQDLVDTVIHGDEEHGGRAITEVRSELWEALDGLYQELVLTPGRKLLEGELLSPEEFHFLKAGGTMFPLGDFPDLIKATGWEMFNEYDIYKLLHYEDDEQSGYIFPRIYRETMRYPQGQAVMINCIEPENVKRSYLREEQSIFFETYFQDEFNCFQP